MSLQIEQAAAFREDFALRALRYVREAGEEVALRFQGAVDATLRSLCSQPAMGRARNFHHPKLRGLRSFRVEKPFDRLVIFYRINGDVLQAARLMHTAQDLPRRLLDPPGAGDVTAK